MSQQSQQNSVYKRIALDIAQGIVSGRYPLNEKIHGRSTLAGIYNVSPETFAGRSSC
jgi:DNA-binding GntR family transcriptional regulator